MNNQYNRGPNRSRGTPPHGAQTGRQQPAGQGRMGQTGPNGRPGGNMPPRGPRILTPEEQEARRRALMEQRKKQAKERRKQEAAAAKEQKKQNKKLEKQKKAAEEKRRKAEERMRRHDERFELTEEEKAIREQMRREERDYNRRRRARNTKVFIVRMFIFLVMFVGLLAISVGLFYANLVRYEPAARRNFALIVGDDYSETIAHDRMERGGALYLNMTRIVEFCEMAVTGDTAELRFISRNTKENVQFIVGSRQVFINGVEERLTAAPILDGEDLYVPYTFFTSYVAGLDFDYDTEKNRIEIQKSKNDATGADELLTFVIRSDAPMTALDEYNEFGKTSPIEFVNDLDLYEQYMNPAARDDYLVLVNSQYPLDQNYVPATEKVDLSDMLLNGQTDQFLNGVAYKAAHAMEMELASNGFGDVKIFLGYRSYTKQRTFYNQQVKEYQRTMSEEQAKIAAASVAQEPGCNPQQAGLSFIMHNMKETDSSFARDPAYGWLAENCWKFGFIIRYPADKTAETGMAFQPYFFTFVGRYHAMRIHEKGMCMEEYIAMLEEKDYFGMPYEEFRAKLLNK